MRVLMTTQPGTGHFTPMVPLAWALRDAGHEVKVACAASFAPRVTAFGLEAIPAGLDWLESEPELAYPEVAEMSHAERELFIIELFSDTAAMYMTHDLLEMFETWQPDVVLRDYSEYGGCVAAECAGIPHAAVGIGIYVPDYISKLVLEKPLAYLRGAYGLPSHPAMEMLTRYLYLLLIPPSFQFPEFPLPPVTHTLRPVFPLGSALADALPTWFFSMPDQPTVYVSMGTVFNRAPEVFQIVLDGLKDEALNLVLTVGRNRDPAQFGPMPENVHIEQFIPQAALIPHCDLVITHGGINTVMGALQEGLPVLTVPLSAHQLENTLRCRQLGVGIDLRPPWSQAIAAEAEGSAIPALSQARTNVAATGLFADEIAALSPESVLQAVRTLLEDVTYRQAAREIQAEIAAQPGPEHAVTLLERLVKDKKPLLR